MSETEQKNYTKELNNVCLVIDMEGFKVQAKFSVRELGWCDYSGVNCYSFHYRPNRP